MKEHQTKTIYFLRVADISSKLNRICRTVQTHFDRKESVLIAVPSQEAAAYIDQLLWRQPEESFLPHMIVNTPTKEMVAITTSKTNINSAKALINLNPDIPKNIDDYLIIYDMLDLTHPAKEQLSRAREAAYRELQHLVEIS